MNLKNAEIRQAIAARRLRCYEVAQAIGVHRSTFSTMLCRDELPPEKTQEILKVIENMEV